MNLFENIIYLNIPKNYTNVLFACDDLYFNKFGIENITSCLQVGLTPHCHVINPSEDTKKKLLDFPISSSIETVLIDNQYQLITYYYCSRFFASLDLFEKFNITELWITDADVIFNNQPNIPEFKFLGISYNKDQQTLWKQTQASLIYVHKNKKEFIKKVIERYLEKLSTTDFSVLDNITDKYERGNILGLDQVCMSLVFNDFYKEDPEFVNLHSISNLKSKARGNGCVTILVGKNKS